MFKKLHILISTVFFFLVTFTYGAPPENTELKNMGELTYLGATLESNTVVATVVYGEAKVRVRKGWEEDSTGRMVLYFKVTNDSFGTGKDLLLRDDLNNKYELAGETGIWIPFGENAEKVVTLADDGVEAEDSNIELKYINGILTFKVKEISGPHLESNPGGYLGVYVKPPINLPAGTIIENKGEYEFNNGEELVRGLSTNTVMYVVPIIARGEIIGEKKEFHVSGDTFFFRNKLTNLGNTSDIFEISLANNTFPETAIFTLGKYDENEEFILLEDLNGNGTVETPSLAIGESIDIILRVESASSDISFNNLGVNKLVKSLNKPEYIISTTDSLTQLGAATTSVSLIKFQTLDSNLDNKPDGSFKEEVQKGDPGDRIFYKLVLTNIGTEAILDIDIEDTVPDFTRISYGDGTIGEYGFPSFKLPNGTFGEIIDKPLAGHSGAIRQNFSRLEPGEVIEIYYNVIINE
ncbi:conserved repeat domain-containing protein [Cetobacterium ceti]|uniref:Conserved repeat domain-containing protein n=1 Tax=Cetobacterium ceti TaxID=180163 RepID=A0A1T4QHU6_9FUSO|nr:hypothetical protein [Cetobacterium ceti]SKA02838.1 conserved repeat domain-containing protein [Cetobacterium ceti]